MKGEEVKMIQKGRSDEEGKGGKKRNGGEKK